MKKKVIVLGGSLDQKKLVEALKDRGFYTIIIDYNESPPAKAVADKHYQFSWDDREKVLSIAKTEDVELVLTSSIDKAQNIAAYVSDKLSLDFQISFEQAQQTTNKLLMKEIMCKNDIPTAKHIIIKNNDDLLTLKDFSFPAIMKPVDNSASRGIYVVNNYEDVLKYYPSSLKHSESQTVLVEKFIGGYELSVDCFVVNSQAKVLMITKNVTQLYKSTSIILRNLYEPDFFRANKQKIEQICQNIANAFRLENSPLFVQMKIVDDEIFVIELTARLAGGFKSYFLEQTIGINPLEIYLDVLLGKTVKLEPQYSELFTSLNFVLAEKGIFKTVSSIETLQEKQYIDKFLYSKFIGNQVLGTYNGSDRIGAFINSAETMCALKDKINTVYEQIEVLNENDDNILIVEPFLI